MRWRVAAVAAILALAITACGPSFDPGLLGDPLEQPIIGGSRSNPGDYPPVGVLLTSGTDDFFGQIASMFCTATLIAPDVVLTAAHCAEVESLVFIGGTSDAKVYFSLALDVRSVEQTMTMPADAIEVVQRVKHPDWDIAALETMSGGLVDLRDIAIMILDSPITSVEPAVVLEADDVSGVTIGASVEIVGYGQRSVDDQTTTGVKYQAVSEIHQVGSSEMQVGSVPATLPQKCHGDSGGPSFLQVDDQQAPALRIVGVTSHAFDDTDCAKGGVDTMVYPYLAWLDQALTAACSSQVRTACEGGGGLPLPRPMAADAGVPVDAAPARDAAIRRDSSWVPPHIDASLDVKTVAGGVDVADSGCGCAAAGRPASWLPGAALATIGLLGWRRRGWRK